MFRHVSVVIPRVMPVVFTLSVQSRVPAMSEPVPASAVVCLLVSTGNGLSLPLEIASRRVMPAVVPEVATIRP